MKYTITRENNKYNKYKKWHLLGISELTGGKLSLWFNTRKEAEYQINRFEVDEKNNRWAQMPRVA